MNDVELTVGFCACREAENLRTLLPQIVVAARELTPAFEVLVIDTAIALDETEAICRAHGARYVQRRGGNNYADALRTLLAEAGGEYLIHMDADGSHRPADIAALWHARQTYDVVIGSRYVSGARTNNPLRLRLMSWCLNAAWRVYTGLAIRDFSNSLRLYRFSLLATLQLRSKHFEVLQELLMLLLRQNPALKIGEVPVIFEQRVRGNSKRKLLRFLAGYARVFLQTRNSSLRNPKSF